MASAKHQTEAWAASKARNACRGGQVTSICVKLHETDEVVTVRRSTYTFQFHLGERFHDRTWPSLHAYAITNHRSQSLTVSGRLLIAVREWFQPACGEWWTLVVLVKAQYTVRAAAASAASASAASAQQQSSSASITGNKRTTVQYSTYNNSTSSTRRHPAACCGIGGIPWDSTIEMLWPIIYAWMCVKLTDWLIAAVPYVHDDAKCAYSTYTYSYDSQYEYNPFVLHHLPFNPPREAFSGVVCVLVRVP